MCFTVNAPELKTMLEVFVMLKVAHGTGQGRAKEARDNIERE